jgi:hypothetical protein
MTWKHTGTKLKHKDNNKDWKKEEQKQENTQELWHN